MPDEDIYDNQESSLDEDTTSENEFEDVQLDNEDNGVDAVALQKQKEHWRSKAVDKESGKTYKELYEEATKIKEQLAKPKEKVSKNDESESLREELTRVRLESKGFNDDEQDVILKASKALGITAVEAAKDDIVIGKINAMREEIKTNNAIPSPSGKAGKTDTNSVDYYLRTGEIPEDDALADKVDEERIRRAKEQI
jgi:hypothetical protein